MKQLQLTGSDLVVSPLCLGTNQFGTSLNDAAAAAVLDAFISAGGNFIDTARSYGDWIPDASRAASEHALGRLLAGRDRASVVIATKGCEFDYRAGDFALRVTPAHLREDLAGSLDALQCSYVDLYWLHRDDPAQPVPALIDALIAQQQAGRIRHFGCSNWSPARIRQAQAYAAKRGHQGFVACQPMWGLAEPDRTAMQSYAPGGYYEDGYRELHEQGLPMIPYSAQSRGVFSKLAAGVPLAAGIAALYDSDTNRRKLMVIEMVAARHRVSINEVILAYLLCQPYTTIPIIGCGNAQQLRESVLACELQLDAGELATLRNA